MPAGARRALPFQSINKKEKEMKQEVLKEVYEVPRIAVRGIVLEEGIAETCSVLGNSITQDDWNNSDTPVGEGASRDGDVYVNL
jgi:hypothetical protein